MQNHPYPPILSDTTSFLAHHIKTTKYQTIAVKTKGRSLNEAFDTATSSVNYVRGVWTLFATFRSFSMRFSGPHRETIGKIHTGPVQTMHCTDGSLASENYWYDPDYVEDANVFSPRKGWEKLEEERTWAFEKIDELPYKDDLIAILARYAVAIDHANLDLAFLRLWSLLEKITDTIGANYDETIKRSVWMHRDHSTAKQLLAYMRLRRNQFVHSASSFEDREHLCYMIKAFIDPHLVALLRNDFGVDSIKGYAEFLGLPHSVDRLTKLADVHQRALNIRRSWIQSDEEKDTF